MSHAHSMRHCCDIYVLEYGICTSFHLINCLPASLRLPSFDADCGREQHSPASCKVQRTLCLVCCLQDPNMILSNPVKPDCVAPDVAFKGSMVYWYNSTSYRYSLTPVLTTQCARPRPGLTRQCSRAAARAVFLVKRPAAHGCRGSYRQLRGMRAVCNVTQGLRLLNMHRGSWCRDDLAWAAAWLYRETGDNAYLSDAYFFYSQHQTQEGDYDKRYLVRSSSPCLHKLPCSLRPLTSQLQCGTCAAVLHCNALACKVRVQHTE